MSNIKDFSSYLEEVKQIKLGDKTYTVNESNKAYLNFKKEMAKAKDQDDSGLMAIILENAFGKDNSDEIMNTVPMRVVRQICDEVTEAWMGQRIFQLQTPESK